MNNLEKPFIEDEGYHLEFPLSVTGERVDFEGKIETVENYLDGRNIFFLVKVLPPRTHIYLNPCV